MSSPDARIIFFKLVLEAMGREAAELEFRTINAGLATIGGIGDSILRPHFNYPNQWEVIVHINPPESAFTTFERLIELADSGWDHGDSDPGEDRWAVWNRTDEVVLLTPAVFWANVETGFLPAKSDPAD